jgi:hypothetical protein
MYLFRDNIPTVPVQLLPLDVWLFEDDGMRGVVPILFADDPSAAELAMAANPDLARRDVCRLQKLFLVPESIDPISAIQVPSNV